MLKFDREDEFKAILRDNIRPAQPIVDPQLLQGRAVKLKEIDRAFNSHGMHVFIHGDRGVGKTSLALTAATLKHPSSSEPPQIQCDHRSSFFELMTDLVSRMAGDIPRLQSEGATTERIGASLGTFLNWSRERAAGLPSLPTNPIRTVNEAIQLIAEAVSLRAEDDPVAVIDEFDRLENPTDKKHFAEFLKGVHDRRLPVRFIFCGVGHSIDDLTGGHLSSSRPLHPIVLERLPHDARWAIVENAAEKLGVKVDREFSIRIGQISDGFPYYVHLMAQNLFWSVFDHMGTSMQATIADFHEAVRGAIEQSESPLKNAYNLAVQKTKGSKDYEEVLWAVAADTHFERQFIDIYETSYLRLMQKRGGREPLGRDRFRARLYRLVDESHGRILVRSPNSWYSFRENVVRGYVRLKAEREGIQLGADVFKT